MYCKYIPYQFKMSNEAKGHFELIGKGAFFKNLFFYSKKVLFNCSKKNNFSQEIGKKIVNLKFS